MEKTRAIIVGGDVDNETSLVEHMTGVYAFFYAMGAMDVGKLPLLLIVAKKAGVARCYGDWGPEFLPESGFFCHVCSSEKGNQ